MCVRRVGQVGQAQRNDVADRVAAPLITRGSTKTEQANNAISLDTSLQKIEKTGKISLREFSKMSGLVDGGKEALGQYLISKGIATEKTVQKLQNSPDPNFADSFNKAASSKSLGVKSIFAKLTVLATGGVALIPSLLAKNNFEVKVEKSAVSDVRRTEGTSKVIHDLKQVKTKEGLEKFVKDNGITPAQYDALSKHIPFDVQSKMDTQKMSDTLKTASPGKASALKKIFFAMQSGNMQIRKEGSKETQPWPHDMASALSHGGRVCMVMERDQVDDFLAFVMSGNENERKILGDKISAPSSHGIDHDSDDTGMGFSESKLSPVTVPFRKTENFGLNLAVGEKGAQNLWGETIQEDGTFGHLLIAVDRSREPAVIMFGIENSQPGKSNQYGGSHDIDCHAGDTSPSGGTKWKNMSSQNIDIPAPLGGMIVDFRGTSSHQIRSSYDDIGRTLTPEQLVGKQMTKDEMEAKFKQEQSELEDAILANKELKDELMKKSSNS